ncbi:beta strand repeat-containing protein [Bradyrhizobium sp. AZCC 2289]|uniref:beta strand repeat-containing protein n=1 Tax=Bradyrhizobium sp. AZCC 2289 TaxID=3117026 RepID=UPI002FF36889
MTLSNGATLHGTGVTDQGGGVFTLTATSAANLSGLTITPASEFEGTVHVGVSAVAHDDAAVSAPGSASTTLTVNPVADLPVVTASAATINEGGSSALTIGLTNAGDLFVNGDDSVALTVTLSNGATLHGTGVTDQGGGVFTLTAHSAADLNGLTITPASEFEGNVSVGVSAIAHDGSAVSAAGSTSTNLTVSPFADQPDVSASATTINEDGSSALTITLNNAADLFENGDDSVTVQVTLSDGATLNGSGVSSLGGGVFQLTAHNGSYATDLAGLTITPAHEFEGTVTVGVSATAHDGAADSTIGSTSTNLTVNPVADQPDVSASATTINEDGSSALTITLANASGLFENIDDSVTVQVTLSDGATLNGTGVTNTGPGTFTLTAHSAADLNGLTITPAHEFEGTVTVGVSAVAHDGAVDSTIGSTSTNLTVSPVADQPDVSASATTINEDGSSALTITLNNASGLFENIDDSVTVQVTLSDGATLNGTGVTNTGPGTFTLTAHSAADLNGLTITPAHEFEGTVTVGVSATAHDGAAVSAAGSTSTTLIVSPVADVPVVTASAATINEDGSSALTITLNNAADLFENGDDSVTVQVTLSDGATLNGSGVSSLGGGVFQLTAHNGSYATDLAGLTITPAHEFEGTVTVGVSATAHDGAADSTIGSTSTNLTVNPVADQPDVSASATTINEDGSSALTITLANASGLFENIDDSVTVQVTLSDGATLNGTGVTNTGPGTFTLTAHSAADLNGLTITPAHEFEGTMTVGVSAVAHDGAVDSTIGSTSTNLTVSPVADVPEVTASATTVNEDTSSTLTITLANAADLFENGDDSVTLTVTLSDGATLHGTGVTDQGGGVFTLTAHSVSDLSGLTITPAHEFEGTVTVGVSATAHDGAAVSAAGSTSTTLIVNPVADVPVVTASAATINEDGSSALTITLANAADLFENGDDSVVVTVTLSNGATLHGTGVTAVGGGVFTLSATSAANLGGLTITPATEFEGNVSVGVSAVAHDGSAVSAAGSTSTTLIVNPVADVPVVTASASTINEDGTSNLTIGLTNAANLFENVDDSVVVTVTLSNGATLHGTGVTAVGGGVFTLSATSAANLGGLTPATEFEGNVSVGVSAVAHDGSAVSAAGSTSTTLIVNPLPEAPTLDLNSSLSGDQHTGSVSGNQNTAIPIYIQSAPSEVDPDATFVINISGLPAGTTLNHGVHNLDGSYTLTQTDLTGLTLTETGTTQHFTLTVDAQVTEGSLHADTTGTIDVTVNTSPVSANGERFVISEGSTWDDTFTKDLLANDSSPSGGIHLGANALFNSSGQAASTAISPLCRWHAR